MKTEIIRQFDITLSGIDEAQADVLCKALHEAYKSVKDAAGYCDPKATILREARNAFADAVGRHYMGEDA